MASHPTAERVRELYVYEPETGKFFRRFTAGGRVGGSEAGTSKDSRGYFQMSVDGRLFLCHRVAWLYVHGEWPGIIDHINGDRLDNRIANLRPATHSQNMQNRRGPNVGNTAGLLGASWKSSNRRWVAQIVVDGRKVHIGYYDTALAAHLAYLTAKRREHAFCTI